MDSRGCVGVSSCLHNVWEAITGVIQRFISLIKEIFLNNRSLSNLFFPQFLPQSTTQIKDPPESRPFEELLLSFLENAWYLSLGLCKHSTWHFKLWKFFWFLSSVMHTKCWNPIDRHPGAGPFWALWIPVFIRMPSGFQGRSEFPSGCLNSQLTRGLCDVAFCPDRGA